MHNNEIKTSPTNVGPNQIAFHEIRTGQLPGLLDRAVRVSIVSSDDKPLGAKNAVLELWLAGESDKQPGAVLKPLLTPMKEGKGLVHITKMFGTPGGMTALVTEPMNVKPELRLPLTAGLLHKIKQASKEIGPIYRFTAVPPTPTKVQIVIMLDNGHIDTIENLFGLSEPVNCVDVAMSKKPVLVMGYGKDMILHDAKTGAQIESIPTFGKIVQVTISRINTGNVVAVQKDGTAFVRLKMGGKVLRPITMRGVDSAYFRDGFLVIGNKDGTVTYYNVATYGESAFDGQPAQLDSFGKGSHMTGLTSITDKANKDDAKASKKGYYPAVILPDGSTKIASRAVA